jgi:hypothetical protein
VSTRQAPTDDIDRATAVNDQAASWNVDAPPETFPADYPSANTQSVLGPIASDQAQNYTFGSMRELTRTAQSWENGSGELVIAQNGSGSSGGTQSGIGGGGASGASSGGGTASRVVEAAAPTVTTVPDSGSSVALLGFGLAAIGCACFHSNKRARITG